jgi:hypothetical protein
LRSILEINLGSILVRACSLARVVSTSCHPLGGCISTRA